MNKQATSSALANRNPLRYRGYYYDVETGFYYLQSRYYDPATRRFINADVYSSTDTSDAVSCNMFAYCNNNPVIASDENGEWLNLVVGAIVGAVVNTAAAILEGKPIDEVIVSGVCGAASGALTAAGFGAAAGAVTSFIDSAYSNTKDVIAGNKTIGQAIAETVVDTAVGTAFGAMGSGSTADIAKSNQISSAGWNGLKTMFRDSARPAAKKAAKKAVKAAGKYAAKSFFREAGSSIVVTGISKGVNWCTGRIYKTYASIF